LRVVEQGLAAEFVVAGRASGDMVDDQDEPIDRDASRLVLPSPTDPMAVARRFVAEQFSDGPVTLLRAWRGEFRGWDGRAWPERDEATVRSDLYGFTETAAYLDDAGKARPWRPTKAKVSNVLEALRAIVHLPARIEPPAWLDGVGPDPADLIVMANGVLDLASRELRPHDSRLFVLHALPFAYDPAAPPPAHWLAFLADLWRDDVESIALAQEIFGYVLGGDTSLQKIPLLVGPPRAGKGVFANTLEALVGRHNTAAPTLAGLTSNFGLQDLIGKTLAVVSDARLGSRTNIAALAECLLSISGEDAITIDRKYRDPWTGRLPVRFLLLTNELPRFSDVSTALAKRLVVLVLVRSFYGVEDPALLGKIVPELPGILNWALDGRARLRARGRFTAPASATGAVRALEDLASPITAFLREMCVRQNDAEVPRDALWSAWKSWCEEQSLHHGTKAVFGRDLRAAVPGLGSRRPIIDGDRQWFHRGVGLRVADDGSRRLPGLPGPWHGGSTESSEHRPGPDGPDSPGSPGVTASLSRPRATATPDPESVEADYPESAWQVDIEEAGTGQ
jgi:putative DNA primase/helicase